MNANRHRHPHHRRPVPAAGQQRGAVLYIALILLILLALLGVAGMQVASMQERMASNYRAMNRAFQNTEGVVRNAERSIEAVNDRTSLPTGNLVDDSSISQICDDGFDPVTWGRAQSAAAVPAATVRRIDTCVPGESGAEMGGTVNNATATFQITGYAADDPNNSTSASVVDTVFKI